MTNIVNKKFTIPVTSYHKQPLLRRRTDILLDNREKSRIIDSGVVLNLKHMDNKYA